MPEDKHIDESWKETASEEKERLESSVHEKAFEMTFQNYLMSLVFQVMVFLGEIPNPTTNQVDKNFDQAKLLIDTLLMLREKTQGNLSKEESNFLNGSLYELQMKYVELTQQKG